MQRLLDGLLGGWVERHRRFERQVAEMAAQRSGPRSGFVVAEGRFDGDVATGRRGDEGILDRHRAGGVQVYGGPDAGVAAADGGDPVPSDGGMVGGVVGAQRAAVLAGAIEGLLRHASRRGVLLDAHRQRVLRAGAQVACDIEPAAHEAAFDAADLFAVQVDLGLPIDTVEVQPDMPPAGEGWHVGRNFDGINWKAEVYQLIPSKFSQTCRPLARGGAANSTV